MNQQSSYPIQQLDPNASTDQQKQEAIQATIQQMITEGMSPEEAQQKVMQMMQAMASFVSRGSQMQRSTATGFASDGNGGGTGNSNDYQSQKGLNRSFTNWTPMKMPPGGRSPGFTPY